MATAATSAAPDRFMTAIAQLERAAVSPRAGTRWRSGVRHRLRALREALGRTDPHMHGAAIAGPYAELCRDAPELVNVMRRLGHEREKLTAAVDGLMARSTAEPPAAVSRAVEQLLADVRRYRRHISDLLYQAYTVDIGGEM